jgi:hypothetical protein
MQTSNDLRDELNSDSRGRAFAQLARAAGLSPGQIRTDLLRWGYPAHPFSVDNAERYILASFVKWNDAGDDDEKWRSAVEDFGRRWRRIREDTPDDFRTRYFLQGRRYIRRQKRDQLSEDIRRELLPPRPSWDEPLAFLLCRLLEVLHEAKLLDIKAGERISFSLDDLVRLRKSLCT